LQKNNKKYWEKLILFIIFCLSLFGLIFSIYKLILWKIDSDEITKEIDSINKLVKVTETEDAENTEKINPPDDEFDPYWDYIDYPLIDVDFTELKKINPDTKGWLQVSGTNINYPFVQRHDNEFYLNHSFYQKPNNAGWVFLDYRNDISNLDQNSIIYAHGRVNKVMFGTLKNIIKSDWYANKENHIIRLSTESENTLWQVFSVYRVETTNDYLYKSFATDKNYQYFLELITNRSVFEFNSDPNTRDKILTLSTCYDSTSRVVMHAKLMKRSATTPTFNPD